MEYIRYLPYFIILFLVIITRRNQHKQLQTMTREEQGLLNKSLLPYRMLQYTVIVLVLIPVFIFSEERKTILIILFSLEALIIMGWLVSGHILIKKKLTDLKLPDDFIRFQLIDRLLLSLLLFFLIVQFYLGPAAGFW